MATIGQPQTTITMTQIPGIRTNQAQSLPWEPEQQNAMTGLYTLAATHFSDDERQPNEASPALATKVEGEINAQIDNLFNTGVSSTWTATGSIQGTCKEGDTIGHLLGRVVANQTEFSGEQFPYSGPAANAINRIGSLGGILRQKGIPMETPSSDGVTAQRLFERGIIFSMTGKMDGVLFKEARDPNAGERTRPDTLIVSQVPGIRTNQAEALPWSDTQKATMTEVYKLTASHFTEEGSQGTNVSKFLAGEIDQEITIRLDDLFASCVHPRWTAAETIPGTCKAGDTIAHLIGRVLTNQQEFSGGEFPTTVSWTTLNKAMTLSAKLTERKVPMEQESSDGVTAKTLFDSVVFSSIAGRHFGEDANPYLAS